MINLTFLGRDILLPLRETLMPVFLKDRGRSNFDYKSLYDIILKMFMAVWLSINSNNGNQAAFVTLQLLNKGHTLFNPLVNRPQYHCV
jgi:hypothetical protein